MAVLIQSRHGRYRDNKRGLASRSCCGPLGVDAAGADGGGDAVDGQHVGGDAIVDRVRLGVAENIGEGRRS